MQSINSELISALKESTSLLRYTRDFIRDIPDDEWNAIAVAIRTAETILTLAEWQQDEDCECGIDGYVCTNCRTKQEAR